MSKPRTAADVEWFTSHMIMAGRWVEIMHRHNLQPYDERDWASIGRAYRHAIESYDAAQRSHP